MWEVWRSKKAAWGEYVDFIVAVLNFEVFEIEAVDLFTVLI